MRRPSPSSCPTSAAASTHAAAPASAAATEPQRRRVDCGPRAGAAANEAPAPGLAATATATRLPTTGGATPAAAAAAVERNGDVLVRRGRPPPAEPAEEADAPVGLGLAADGRHQAQVWGAACSPWQRGVQVAHSAQCHVRQRLACREACEA